VKERITLGLTISATGTKLKPIVICKGESDKCLNKFNLNKNIIGTHSSSGWINENIMLIVLDQIAKCSGGEKSILLLDQYDAHKTDKVKEYAESKNIILIYIPVGMTYKYQPLDVGINGILKAKMKQFYAEFLTSTIKFNDTNKIIEDTGTAYTHALFIKDVIRGWKSISIKTIKHSFDCLSQ